MKFHLNSLSGRADRKLQVSFLNPSPALYPADLAPLVNLVVTRGIFLNAVKNTQNYSDFIPVIIYLLTSFFAQSINFHMQSFLEQGLESYRQE